MPELHEYEGGVIKALMITGKGTAASTGKFLAATPRAATGKTIFF
jgi:hypothetical protein